MSKAADDDNVEPTSDPTPEPTATEVLPPLGAGAWAPPVVASDAPAAAEAGGVQPPPPDRRLRRGLLLAVGALVVAAGVAVAVVATHGGGDDAVEVDGESVVNADEALAGASAAFAEVAAQYGAATADGTGCFWEVVDTPAGDELNGAVCGPARFAAGGDWVEVPISLDTDGDKVVVDKVTFDGATFSGPPIVDADDVSYHGVDGAKPAIDADLAEPSRAGRAYAGDGRVIDGADEVVAAGVAAVASLGDSAEPVNVHPDASCWVATGSTAGDAAESLVCGPVLALSDDPTTPWREASFTTTDGPGPWAVTTDPTGLVLGGQVALPAANALWHPDGAAPPSTTGFGLPDPPPQATDYLAVTDAESVADVALTAAPPLDLRMPDYTARLVSFGSAPRIGTGPDALIAADGQQFVIATFEIDRTNEFSDDGSSAVVLAVDGERRTLDVAAAGYGSDRYALVASVPVAALRVDLEVQDRGRAQAVSLRDGSSTATVAGVDRHGKEVGVNATFTMSSASVDGGVQVQLAGSLSTVTTHAWNSSGQWAPDGKVYLGLSLADPAPADGTSAYLYETDWARSLSVVLADGTVVPATIPDDPVSAEAPDEILFEVPADATAATLSIARYGTDYDSRTYGEIETVPSGEPVAIAIAL